MFLSQELLQKQWFPKLGLGCLGPSSSQVMVTTCWNSVVRWNFPPRSELSVLRCGQLQALPGVFAKTWDSSSQAATLCVCIISIYKIWTLWSVLFFSFFPAYIYFYKWGFQGHTFSPLFSHHSGRCPSRSCSSNVWPQRHWEWWERWMKQRWNKQILSYAPCTWKTFSGFLSDLSDTTVKHVRRIRRQGKSTHFLRNFTLFYYSFFGELLRLQKSRPFCQKGSARVTCRWASFVSKSSLMRQSLRQTARGKRGKNMKKLLRSICKHAAIELCLKSIFKSIPLPYSYWRLCVKNMSCNIWK